MNYIYNIFFIKNTNGLYYYGLDTVKSLKYPPKTVLVNHFLYRLALNSFPNSRVVSCGVMNFIYEILIGLFSGYFIYTPSSHPLPFINKQIVVLHDTYPFRSFKGSIKKLLFLFSAKSSKCLLVYINHSDGHSFYKKFNFNASRLIFLPNKFTGKITEYHSNRPLGETRLIIGLVGTDSPKKNYKILFDEINKLGFGKNIIFQVYGHSNQYLSNLQMLFPHFSIFLNNSNDYHVSDFLATIDVIVSVAENEGFGRPIASALESGVPCYLIDNAIFREFFSGGAVFSPDAHTLVKNLLQDWSSNKLLSCNFIPRSELIESFSNSISKLDKM